MAAAAADRLPDCHRPIRSILAQENRTPDAHLDHLSLLCGHVFTADLFHRLQTAGRRIGMERIASGGCAAQWGSRGTPRAHLLFGLCALQSKVSDREPAKICDLPWGISRLMVRRPIHGK